MRHLNLIFQGGGVKGIAYAGALQSLPPDIQIRGLGGTSAGAIIAALLAVNKRGKELEDILRSPELSDLLAKEEADRYSRFRGIFAQKDKLKTALQEAVSIWAPGKKKSWRTLPQRLYRLRQFQEKHSQLLADVDSFFRDAAACWNAKGAHRTTKLRAWLNKHLGATTFKDVEARGIDLRIVAADVKGRQYVVFNSEDYSLELLARAVHASLSIPVFFEPLQANDGECFVDGGLLSNFPSFLFNSSPYPTVGFRLSEYSAELTSTTEPLGYLIALLETMASAHDKWRERFQHFKSYEILTPPYIPFDKFALTKQDVNELYLCGKTVGQTVKWNDDDHSSEDKLIGYFDPNPNRVLHIALQEAERLAEEHLAPAAFVDEIHQLAELEVRVDRDWTTHYNRLDKITVIGAKSLFLQRIRVGVKEHIGKRRSLADIKPICEEVTNGTSKPLAFIPAFNREDRKGFVFFYSPPIDSASPRDIHSAITFQGEFTETLGRGEEDEILFEIVRRAHKHVVKIKLILLLPLGIRDLKLNPNFESGYNARIIKRSGESFQEHVWELPEQEFMSVKFPLQVTLK